MGIPIPQKTALIIIGTSLLRTRRGNGPSLVRVVTLPSLDPWEQTSVRFESTCNIFFSRKYISKWRLQHDGFVQAAMWRKAKQLILCFVNKFLRSYTVMPLKHWGWDKIDANLQITPSNIFFFNENCCVLILTDMFTYHTKDTISICVWISFMVYDILIN